MDQFQFQIRRLLNQLLVKRKSERLIRGGLLLITASSSMLFLSLLGHVLFGIDAVIRFVLLIGVLSVMITILIHQIILPLAGKVFPETLARELDRSVEALEGSLLPVLDLQEIEGNPKRPFSIHLKRLAGQKVWQALSGRPREEIYRATGSGKRTAVFILLLVFITSCGLWYTLFYKYGRESDLALHEFIHPVQSMADENVWYFEVSPGDTSVLRGETPLIRVAVDDNIFVPVVRKPFPIIHFRVGTGKWNSLPMTPEGEAHYFALLSPLHSECSYYLQLDRRKSSEYSIDVIDLPSVTWLKYKLRHPEYSGLADSEVQDQGGGLSVLLGTLVELMGSSNNMLDSAWIEDERGVIPATVEEGRFFKASFEATETKRFKLKLIDSAGNAGGDSLAREILVMEDRAPSVQVLVPGQDVMVPKDLRLPLVVRAEDDYGLKSADLVCWNEENGKGSIRRLAIERLKGSEKIFQASFLWNLSELQAQAGDVFYYYVEAVDNDAVSGPKAGRSKTYLVKFPTMAEYLRHRLEGEKEISSGVEEILAEARRLSELSGELEKKLRGAEDVDWEKQREIEDVAERGEELLEEIKDVCTMIENSIGGEDEELFSNEVLEKMMEVRDLLEKLATPEMRDAIDRIHEAMESVPPSLLEQAMRNFRLNQEQLAANLDRTLTALKRLELEQRLEAIRTGLEKLGEKQAEVVEKLEFADRGEMNQLADRQKRIADELSALADEMEKAAEQMETLGETEADHEMDEIVESAEGEATETMREAMMAMQGGLKGSATQSGQQATEKLKTLEKSIAGLLNKLRSTWKEQTEDAIARALSDLVTLSRKQELIIRHVEEHGNRFGPDVGKEILAQQELLAGLQLIAQYLDEAAQNSFFIGPDVIISLGMSIAKSHEAAVMLNRGESTPREVAKLAGESLSHINQTAVGLLKDLESLQCSSSGIGLEEAFREMAQLAQMQAGLNQGTQDLLMPLPGSGLIKLTEKERALLVQLAAQQRAISEGLERLSDATAGSRNILGKLRELSRDTEEIAREMESHKVSPDILNRQKRILSRLLDAQKSIQERDYSRKRRAEPGDLIVGNPPSSMEKDALEGSAGKSLIELMESWKGTYPKRYRNLVFEYLREMISTKITERQAGVR